MNIGKYIELYSEDLRLKNYSENSIDNYESQVRCFLNRFQNNATKPSEISKQKIKEWLLESNSINGRRHRLSALKLFYKFTVKQPMKLKYIEYPRSDKKLPTILSQEEIKRMFEVCQNKKHLAILSLLYGTGMRVGELVSLKWQHIDRANMVIHIVAGKGKKDRLTPLPESIIPILEDYWRVYRTKEYVFGGQFSDKYSATSVGQVVKQLAQKAGIKKRVWTHLLRHCTFSHMVDSGTEMALVQKIAGHNNIKTTNMYLHTSSRIVSRVSSPINHVLLFSNSR